MKENLLTLAVLAVVAAYADHAAAGSVVATSGTRANPVIVAEYDAAELAKGIEGKQSIGRGRDFAYSITDDHIQVTFTNDHRTRGWHLCLAVRALDADRQTISHEVMKQGLRAKGWRGRDRKVQEVPTFFPEHTAYIQVQTWRCSEKDFLEEMLTHLGSISEMMKEAESAARIVPAP
jgi:hypothetical protein